MTDNMKENLFNKFRQCTQMMHRYRHHAHHNLHDVGLHPSQGRLLLALSENFDGVLQSRLAEEFFMRPASLSELLSKLEQKGYIEKTANQEDRRAVNIHLTAEGKLFAEKVKKTFSTFHDDMFKNLTNEEQIQLASLLDKIIDDFKDSLSESGHSCREHEHGHHMHHGHGRHGHHGPGHGRHGEGHPREIFHGIREKRHDMKELHSQGTDLGDDCTDDCSKCDKSDCKNQA